MSTNISTGTNLVEIAPDIDRIMLACMHGSAWRGDGAALLRALAASLREQRAA